MSPSNHGYPQLGFQMNAFDDVLRAILHFLYFVANIIVVLVVVLFVIHAPKIVVFSLIFI